MILYYYVALYIQCTQIKVKRLEATCRSPIYSNFSEVLAGLATIRAYRQADRFAEINHKLVSDHVAAFLTTTGGLQAWMTVRLNSMSAFLCLAVCICAVYIKDLMSPGDLGVALAYSMSIVQLLSFLITMSTEVQSLMNSVERIKMYADNGIPTEASQLYNETKKAVNGNAMVKIPKSWPETGLIKVNSLVMGYRDGPDVIKGLELVVPGGHKVGAHIIVWDIIY
jgi:ATP-binding cassette subfamily C (CFTR/MRP) protein 1